MQYPNKTRVTFDWQLCYHFARWQKGIQVKSIESVAAERKYEKSP